MIDRLYQPWSGFVYIRCEHCGTERALRFKIPTNSYYCKTCARNTHLTVQTKAFVNCECGANASYSTNMVEEMFDIPCYTCGRPNTVEYRGAHGKYYPVTNAPKTRKKKGR